MISYICNKQRFCRNDDCLNKRSECSHTSDLIFAKNWDRVPTQEELDRYFVRYGAHQVTDPDYYEDDIRLLDEGGLD